MGKNIPFYRVKKKKKKQYLSQKLSSSQFLFNKLAVPNHTAKEECIFKPNSLLWYTILQTTITETPLYIYIMEASIYNHNYCPAPLLDDLEGGLFISAPSPEPDCLVSSGILTSCIKTNINTLFLVDTDDGS